MEIGMSSAIQGVQRAVDTNAARGARIAKGIEGDDQIEKDLAELPTDAPNLSAQIQVIKTQDKMLGDLLDIFS